MKTEYVASGCRWILPHDGHTKLTSRDNIKAAIHNLMDFVRANIAKTCIETDPEISFLFNGYVEEALVKKYTEYDNMGGRAVYSDSGGLQVMSRGKENTLEIRDKIYKTQCYADLAFCFDEIEVRLENAKRSTTERVRHTGKKFLYSRIKEAATATGKNVARQCEVFRDNGANTKVIIIAQGNEASDLVEYYEAIASQLKPWHYNHIAGISPGGACMGPGLRESFDRIIAAKKIADICHPNVRKQMHVLGLGSLARTRPFIYLRRSGYLKAFDFISYDSTTHTSLFHYGKKVTEDGFQSLKERKSEEAVTHFKEVYDKLGDYLSQYVTFDELHEVIFGDGHDKWNHKNITVRAAKLNNENQRLISVIIPFINAMYLIWLFLEGVENIWNEEFPILKDGSNVNHWSELLTVRDDQDMDEWYYKWITLFGKKSPVESKRMKTDKVVEPGVMDYFV